MQTMQTAAADGAATGTAREAADVLVRARRLVDPALRAAVDTLPGAMHRINGYHLGWLDAAGQPTGAGVGKVVRPALVMAAAEAFGGRAEDCVPAAAAVELVHNFTLLHDDVMDNDATRRHRPTAWAVFGVPDAILAGDALHGLAQRLLADDPHPASARAAGRLASCLIELCEGQHADCAFETRTDVSIEECLAMAEAKTGALLGSACALGALYAGAGEPAVAAMDAFGRQIGLAFQLIDDLIGIWGDPAVTGKQTGADLVARKKSLPVVAALVSGTAAGAQLAELYFGDQPLGPEEVRRAARCVEQAGGREWARAQADRRIAAALAQFELLVPDQARGRDLLLLAELVTRRDH
ncbi:MAG TPA: family 2 encapsulin nanocompartment cargo protein polyprenyl transferase [Actinocrinis sp.]|nr:family 2 encapsulin nanocompartment cargo protein polyprenyl transferase [Actinocrinis sp.]